VAIKTSRFAASFQEISRLSSALTTLRWYGLALHMSVFKLVSAKAT